MLGAIIGDVVGSVYEFDNTKDYNFHLLTPRSEFTDGDDARCSTVAVGGRNAQSRVSGTVHAGAGTEVPLGWIWRQLQTVAHRMGSRNHTTAGATEAECESVL